MEITVGVLALQGAFYEHLQRLNRAAKLLDSSDHWQFIQVRTTAELNQCDALIVPGGESTAIALVAARSGLLEPLRDFVKVHRKPTWGTCAGLILLAESANRTKQGGQELIGGLNVRVNRNHFGRQTESFQTPLTLDFLADDAGDARGPPGPFNGIFIRAPVVERILPHQAEESRRDDSDTVVAPSRPVQDQGPSADKDRSVEVLAKLPGRAARLTEQTGVTIDAEKDAGDIVAVKQGNVFGTSFHPELTDDPRIHLWWLRQVREAVHKRQGAAQLPLR